MGHIISYLEKQSNPAVAKRVALSLDIIEIIAAHLFELQPFAYQGDHEPMHICCRKPLWGDVLGFMNASPAFHSIGMTRWVSVLNIRSPKDWNIALRYRNSVRELNCLDGCFDTIESRAALGHFDRLYTLSIDAHGDVGRNPNTGRFAYYTLLTKLPSTVLRLHVKHSHAPDIKIIELVKQYAPSLEELWLGRCTAFNRTPACEFWSAFPFDHDSYIALEGAEDYAQSLAQELAPLKQLALLRMGIYLAPSNIVLAHRVFHSRNLVPPNEINWQHAVAIHEGIQGAIDGAITGIGISQLVSVLHASPEKSFSSESCSFCREAFFQDRIRIEKQANMILREITNLKSISWMNWFSHSHLGLSQEE
ncbi:unnamed protein product [Rhizoctonia solani]|uniref:Uncharacterized protein n=1 Tax=Rhizoctonia solani TaxID=456999 RepID=A0A8H3BPA6_9AGAM|nr:unnamed protein product [Rhizoctonia solani]